MDKTLSRISTCVNSKPQTKIQANKVYLDPKGHSGISQYVLKHFDHRDIKGITLERLGITLELPGITLELPDKF